MNTQRHNTALDMLIAAVVRQAIKDSADTRLPASDRREASELVQAVCIYGDIKGKVQGQGLKHLINTGL